MKLSTDDWATGGVTLLYEEEEHGILHENALFPPPSLMKSLGLMQTLCTKIYKQN